MIKYGLKNVEVPQGADAEVRGTSNLHSVFSINTQQSVGLKDYLMT